MFRFKVVPIFPSGHRGEPGKEQSAKADTSICLKTQACGQHIYIQIEGGGAVSAHPLGEQRAETAE